MHDKLFTTQYFSTGSCPDQGWKLHVSATPWSAQSVLERSLPILLEYGVGCKIVSTRMQLLLLNNGQYGPSQVGKFITVYPGDDTEAVRLAMDLHEATVGLRGPRVPSDRVLRPWSVVHYRYGAFRRVGTRAENEVADALGGLRDNSGRHFPDRRESAFQPPPGITDPFEESGAFVPAESRKPPLAGRYLIVDVLATSAYGGIYRAIDVATRPPRVCVLKEFWRDSGGDLHGRLAPDWGSKEANLLARHNGDKVFPGYFDRFELDGNLFIALEYLEGQSLATKLATLEDRVGRFSHEEAITIAQATAKALVHLHATGVVLRDFNPANIICTPDGTYRLVDFGIAHEPAADTSPPNGLGTADFCSPQQWAGGAPTTTDDVYSWGALLHLLCCGTRGLEASRKSNGAGHGPFERLAARQLRPDLPEQLAVVIDRAVAWNTDDRFPSMLAAQDTLVTLAAQFHHTGILRSDHKPPITALEIRSEIAHATPDPLELAFEVGDALCASAIARDGGMCWATHGGGTSFCGPDLYHGAAGIALFLAELGRACGEVRYIEVARAAARWLAGPVWASGRSEPGLYCGEAGVGWFFVRLGELLDEPGYLTAAEYRARRLRGVPIGSLDLVDGAAGLAIFLARLAEATGKRCYLDEALAVGELLIRAGRPAGDGTSGIYWPSAGGHGGVGRGRSLLGLAHGTAGIALALSELARVSGDERMTSTAHAAADFLLAEAYPHELGGWCWRENLLDESMRVQGQCHGAIGIGQFFVRLARLDPQERYLDAVRHAATTAVREMPYRPSPTLCHGLSGDGMLLLDYSATMNDPHFTKSVRECGSRLQRFRDPNRPGAYMSASGDQARPDLLVGDSGVGWFYLRFARPSVVGDPVLDAHGAP
jgi:hypothetical protein